MSVDELVGDYSCHFLGCKVGQRLNLGGSIPMDNWNDSWGQHPHGQLHCSGLMHHVISQAVPLPPCSEYFWCDCNTWYSSYKWLIDVYLFYEYLHLWIMLTLILLFSEAYDFKLTMWTVEILISVFPEFYLLFPLSFTQPHVYFFTCGRSRRVLRGCSLWRSKVADFNREDVCRIYDFYFAVNMYLSASGCNVYLDSSVINELQVFGLM